MARFEVYSNAALIGWSELEHRDPHMGVAFGKFVPAPAYEKVREYVRSTLHVQSRSAAQAPLSLTVRTPRGADLVNVATIADASTDSTPDDIELELLGIDTERLGDV